MFEFGEGDDTSLGFLENSWYASETLKLLNDYDNNFHGTFKAILKENSIINNGLSETFMMNYEIVLDEGSIPAIKTESLQLQQFYDLIQIFIYIGAAIIMALTVFFGKGKPMSWLLIFIELMSIIAASGGLQATSFLSQQEAYQVDSLNIPLENLYETDALGQRKEIILSFITQINLARLSSSTNPFPEFPLQGTSILDGDIINNDEISLSTSERTVRDSSGGYDAIRDTPIRRIFESRGIDINFKKISLEIIKNIEGITKYFDALGLKESQINKILEGQGKEIENFKFSDSCTKLCNELYDFNLGMLKTADQVKKHANAVEAEIAKILAILKDNPKDGNKIELISNKILLK